MRRTTTVLALLLACAPEPSGPDDLEEDTGEVLDVGEEETGEAPLDVGEEEAGWVLERCGESLGGSPPCGHSCGLTGSDACGLAQDACDGFYGFAYGTRSDCEADADGAEGEPVGYEMCSSPLPEGTWYRCCCVTD